MNTIYLLKSYAHSCQPSVLRAFLCFLTDLAPFTIFVDACLLSPTQDLFRTSTSKLERLFCHLVGLVKRLFPAYRPLETGREIYGHWFPIGLGSPTGRYRNTGISFDPTNKFIITSPVSAKSKQATCRGVFLIAYPFSRHWR